MPVSDTFRDFVLEQLAPLGPVKFRRMFGGGGVYLDGIMFGLVADDVLFLKADQTNQPMFEAEGMGPFVYTAKGKSATMSYWRVPERLYDEPDELVVFAREAWEAARRGVKETSKGRGDRPMAAKARRRRAR